MKKKSRAQLKVMTGNTAAAHGVRLCRPNVIAGYPITPQTEIWDVLYRFKADGLLEGELVQPEGEHSSMSIVLGASAAGGRTFTATSSQGLFFMYEPYISAANQRLPIVMVNANREIWPPCVVTGSGQDILMVKDAGWIQLHCESCQEILDTLIMSYRLAEDPEISLPVIVAYDGYYLSYLSEAVEIPPQEAVDRFLPRRERVTIDPRIPLTISPWTSSDMCTEYRAKHMAALQRSKTKLEEIESEFLEEFGRSYGGQIEEYRCEDAEMVLVTMGSCAGTAKVIVDQKCNDGLRVGLVRVRMFRPFPKERLVQVLKDRKAIGVFDRDVCFGWNCGHLLMELKSALYEARCYVPIANFIGGLSGGDITLQHIERVVNSLLLMAEGIPFKEVTFLDLE